MGKAIGLIEYKTVSSGIAASDILVKTANVEIIQSETVCPGKYFTLIEGNIAAVKSAIDAASNAFPDKLIDSMILGNPHESLFQAIWGTTTVDKKGAIGILETYSVAQAIRGADEAAKTANVTLVELRLARGMCGKCYLILTGEVAAVSAAINRAKMSVGEYGMYLDSQVIAGPDEKTWERIVK